MSDKTLDKLIASLKSEAIDVAENESKKILDAANAQARSIVMGAEKKRDQILAEAEQEAQAIISKGENALRQAARDLHISVQNDLLKLFGAVLEKEIHNAFTPDLLKSAIVRVIENVGSDVALKLPAEFEQEVAGYIHKHLQSSDSLVTLTKDDNLLNGLSITKTEQGWSYQITPEEIGKVLQPFLIPKWIEILKE